MTFPAKCISFFNCFLNLIEEPNIIIIEKDDDILKIWTKLEGGVGEKTTTSRGKFGNYWIYKNIPKCLQYRLNWGHVSERHE